MVYEAMHHLTIISKRRTGPVHANPAKSNPDSNPETRRMESTKEVLGRYYLLVSAS
jgi:hypothetical protein